MITVTQSLAADMDDRKELCVVVVLLLFDRSLPVPIQSMMKIANCDASRSTEPEGNVGQSAAFPWLGLLRVHIHDFDQLKIAVTGLILVKERYAVANADDVSRIPKHVFTQDSKAMFIPKTGDPWFTNLKDYMIHPEFEFATYNTIALVELDLDPGTVVPFKPVCWPGHFFNTSNLLYAVGYTDENELMEKIVYTVQYIKPSLCNEFYNRVGLVV
ncbi:uncharacterized protein LOC114355239 [Ostrinia furnacalis]|uniref:uncharacterized protein LOC114355239 n=1 Tax=Ostrinia furnacalis TaxID=93504 RepID=UPI00103A9B9B|nr:uncharacterized protein LOC114355239 [Ostrinia furnacalis]